MLIFCLVTCLIVLAAPCAAEAPAHSEDRAVAAATQPGKDKKQNRHSRSPRHMVLELRHSFQTLIAGETGTMEVVAAIKPASAPGHRLNWDWKAETPLTVWLSTRQSSGISFLDKANPDRPHHHILVKFPARTTPHTQVLSKKNPIQRRPAHQNRKPLLLAGGVGQADHRKRPCHRGRRNKHGSLFSGHPFAHQNPHAVGGGAGGVSFHC